MLQTHSLEIEDAVGTITDRKRGSRDGGTELTAIVRKLRRQFDRHDTELDGVAQVTVTLENDSNERYSSLRSVRID